jgi:hypothetical protein
VVGPVQDPSGAPVGVQDLDLTVWPLDPEKKIRVRLASSQSEVLKQVLEANS